MEPLEMPMAGGPYWVGIKIWKTVRKSFLITICKDNCYFCTVLKIWPLISLHKAAEESWGGEKKKGYLL